MKHLLLAVFAVCALMAEQRNVEGKKESPVRVVVYEDLQCPDCSVFRNMMDAYLLPRFGAKVAFEHRDFPLPKHAWAKSAAIAARYFDQVKPELGVQFRRETFAHLAEIRPEAFSGHVSAFANSHGLDAAAAVAALSDAKLTAAVEEDYQEGVARGVAKTPTVFVNGEPFIETFSVEAISKSIESAIKEAGL